MMQNQTKNKRKKANKRWKNKKANKKVTRTKDEGCDEK